MKHPFERKIDELYLERSVIIKCLFTGHIIYQLCLKRLILHLFFLHIRLMSSSNIRLLSILTPNSFSHLLLLMSEAQSFTGSILSLLSNTLRLLLFLFIWLSVN